MHEACAEMNLQPDPYFFLKTIQLYEMIVVRHESDDRRAALLREKTCSYRVLARALTICRSEGRRARCRASITW